MSEISKNANEIIKNVGGLENIKSLHHCATRLRMALHDEAKADYNGLNSIDGVLQVVRSGDQLQIVIGQDVNGVYNEINSQWSPNESEGKGKGKSKGKLLPRFTDLITSLFMPIIYVLVAAGMLKAILSALGALSWISAEGQTYYFLNIISDSAFYFLPMLLAYTAAKRFKCNPLMAVAVAGILLHPNFTALLSTGDPASLFGIPVILTGYSGSVLPIILSVWVLSLIEKLINKIKFPKILDFLLKPMIILFITAPLVLIVIGPLGALVGNYVAMGLQAVNNFAPWLAVGIIGALTPLLVMTGMHYALMPLIFQMFATLGFDMLILPAFIASNIAQSGATFAVSIRSKNKATKRLAVSTGITAIFGITEPALYGVTLKLRKPLAAAMIGGGAAGVFAGIIGIKVYALASVGITALPAFADQGSNFVMALIMVGIAFAVAFVTTLLLGFKEKETEQSLSIGGSKSSMLYSPAKGAVIPMAQVNDQTFSKETLGKGIAIIPSEGLITAPFEGKVLSVFPTKHAITLKSKDGVETMIHIGLDTVKLEGKYFESLVRKDAKVKTGDKLIEFDLESIKAAGYDPVITVVIMNSAEYSMVNPICSASVQLADDLMELA